MSTTDKPHKPIDSQAVASGPAAMLKALRPQQWIKNTLVFLPFLFAIDQVWSLDNLDPVPGLVLYLLLVLVAFCALSSETSASWTVWMPRSRYCGRYRSTPPLPWWGQSAPFQEV